MKIPKCRRLLLLVFAVVCKTVLQSISNFSPTARGVEWFLENSKCAQDLDSAG